MKQFFKIILLIITFFVSSPAFAEKFYIENYAVNLNVDKNKSVQIIEDIYTNFTKSSHGIIRRIPLKNASITNISVSEKFSVEKTPQRVSIKIGDANKLVSGQVHYTIKYNYNYQDNKNEFYHNIIGTEWDVPIEKVKFKLTLPENINPDDAGISIGTYGTKGFKDGARYTISEGKIVDFETTKPLKPKEGITFRVPVKEGYFNKYYSPMKTITIFMLILYTAISFILWSIYGKEKHVTSIVSFELPEGINALDAEMIYKEEPTKNGLVALLVELASKGYIKIEENDKGFVLHKLKEFEDKNAIEWDFMNILFGMNKTVSESKLKKSHTYYEKCQKLVEIYKEKNKEKFYEGASVSPKLFKVSMFCVVGIIFCIMATLCNFHIKHMFLPDNFLVDLFKSILAGDLTSNFVIDIAIAGTSWGLLSMVYFNDELDNCSLAFLGIGSLLLAFFLWVFEFTNCTDYTCLWSGIACLIVALICTKNLPCKNALGTEVMGQLKGLKKYIKVSEEHEIKALAEKNPQHFYNILPYAFILGISDIWISKLKKLMATNSEIFEDAYLVNNFSTFTNSMYRYSEPSFENGGISTSSGGGGGSYSSSGGGGGFSGGGGGGGGGSSW